MRVAVRKENRVTGSEPHAEVRALVVHVIEAMDWQAPTSPATDPDAIDLLLVEPGWPEGLELARRMRKARPDLPIVCLSIYPRELDFELLLPTGTAAPPARLSLASQPSERLRSSARPASWRLRSATRVWLSGAITTNPARASASSVLPYQEALTVYPCPNARAGYGPPRVG